MTKILKIFALIFMQFLLSVSLYAQQDVIQFLGIPVDGSKSEMIKKLKGKGYTSHPYSKDVLVGEFNGTDVEIHIVTNNNKVCRIMVSDANTRSVGNIKIRFNNLCRQFQNNKKYLTAPLSKSDYTIPEDDDISYNMSVKNKRYEAIFYQLPTDLDSTVIAKEIQDIFLTKYTEEQLSNFTEEELTNMMIMAGISYMLDKCSKRIVWFMISDERYGRYSISMYYDNEYNRANGEDL